MALVMGAFLIAHNIDLWISFHSSSLNRSIPSINPFDSFLIIKIAMLISVQPTATDDARTRAGPFMIAAYPQDNIVFPWYKISAITHSSIFNNPKTVQVESTLSIKRHTPKRKATFQGSTRGSTSLDGSI